MSFPRRCPLLLCVLCLLAMVPSWSASNPYRIRTLTYRGRAVDEVIVPGVPPPYRMPAVKLPRIHTLSVNTLTSVPTLDWCYGCSATSAAMIFGYYDTHGYPNLYTGSTNGGVFPQDNTAWGSGECPLAATHIGYDGRATRGHVEDYWVAASSSDPDPWITNGWTQHTYADCTGDFMGTNQSSLGNVDSSTTFYYWQDNTPTYDYTGAEPSHVDGCHGMREFAFSRGYTVLTNYNQYIAGYNGISTGFTFANFKAEIDAGYPVMIQVTGHTMVGVGYDDTTQTIYIHDTWDHVTHSMTWGGSYDGRAQYGVTVLHLAPVSNSAPTVPTSLQVTPASPVAASTLQATAAGSTDPDGTTPSYKYQWAQYVSGSWGAWGHDCTDGRLTGVTLAHGQQWRVHACATDGTLASAWTTAVEVTIANTAPATSAVTVSPARPRYNSTLTATATTADADGEALTITYQWRQYTSGAWGAWGYDCTDGKLAGATLVKGNCWQAQARAYDGAAYSDWLQSAPVTIGNYPPSAPTTVTITPTSPNTLSDLRARASGATDPDSDPLTYRYAWSSSSDGGATWSAWGNPGLVLSASKTTRGQQWRVCCRVNDGTAVSAYRVSVPVTIGNTAPTRPTTVTITPANPGYNQDLTASASGSSDADNDGLTYTYLWARSRDAGATWSSWRWSGATLAAFETAKGDLWKVLARATDGSACSPTLESQPVTIGITPVAEGAVLTLAAAAVPTRAGGVALTVSLSSAADVDVAVCNLAGRVVAVLAPRALGQGLNTLLWNVTNTSGTRVPSGTYLLRVTAHGADGSQCQSVATLHLDR